MQRFLLMACALMLLAIPLTARAAIVIINNNNGMIPFQGQRLISAAPYDNQTLDQPPASVTLTFSQPLRPDKSAIKVYDSYGRLMNSEAVTATGASLSVALPPLPPGRYSVKWRARCRCDDDSELSDDFHFTVR